MLKLKRDMENSIINVACYEANLIRLNEYLKTAYSFEIERLIRVDEERLKEEIEFQKRYENEVQYAS